MKAYSRTSYEWPIWLLSLMAFSCVLTQKAQERSLTGAYHAVTDFSRDIQTMNGAKQTIVYKNGREERLRFRPDHRFIKTVHFSTDRVADQKTVGHWKIDSYHIVKVIARVNSRAKGKGNTRLAGVKEIARTTGIGQSPSKHPKKSPLITEYYQFHPGSSQLIRLDANKNQLAPAYAPFFTFHKEKDQPSFSVDSKNEGAPASSAQLETSTHKHNATQ